MRKIFSFLTVIVSVLFFSSCTAKSNNNVFDNEPISVLNLEYATQFSVDFYGNDLSLITIGANEKYLLVPPNTEIPENVPDNITVLKQPIENIYLSASSAMDLFDGINSLDTVRMTSTKKKDWALPSVISAMDSEEILYAGKYSAPDFELILSENCGLAIESTMIYHTPEIKEMLERQGIPVIVERSSYEAHPLGRMEWIKLYGLLIGKDREADNFFSEKTDSLKKILSENGTEKTAAFFYIGTNGNVNVRKAGDYVSKMIELAGGKYIFSADDLNTDDNDLSTMNIQFETFYAYAKDADFLIYNSTVDGGVSDISQLIAKNPLLSDFKAVQNGNVWCTEKNMFQQTTGAADMINELHKIFIGETDSEFEYLYRLK